MIDRTHDLSIAKQAKVLGISRGRVYDLPRPVPAADLAIMRRMDELHLELPDTVGEIGSLVMGHCVGWLSCPEVAHVGGRPCRRSPMSLRLLQLVPSVPDDTARIAR